MINPIRWYRRWQEARQLRKTRIPESAWQALTSDVFVLQHLTHQERHRLRELASLFIQIKSFTGAQGFELTDEVRYQIAAQACLLILNLELDFYAGWHEIIVYPQPFVVRREVMDDAGIVHAEQQVLGGEAWSRGPVIITWSDVRPDVHSHAACSNVILHEFAHKLDMLNGVANGMPPLHAQMQREAWTQVLEQAYKKLHRSLAHGGHGIIDSYAATNPAEFFAVISEVFFTCPHRLMEFDSALYHQLQLFYRQDPLPRYGK